MPGSQIVTQLFGSRDFALGALTATSRGSALTSVLRLGVAIDTADAEASAAQIRAGRMSPLAQLMVAGGAVSFALIGLTALRAPAED